MIPMATDTQVPDLKSSVHFADAILRMLSTTHATVRNAREAPANANEMTLMEACRTNVSSQLCIRNHVTGVMIAMATARRTTY